jgi:hypothetical protein
MQRLVLTLAMLGAAASSSALAQQAAPTDWKWRQDTPAPLATGTKAEQGSWVFVEMPPGWHVTTGPGVLLYPATQGDASGNFSLEAEVFLFPGTSQAEYGVFLGGDNIDGPAPAEYAAFVLRRDGQAAVLRRRGASTSSLVSWQRYESIVPHKGGEDAVMNVIRVEGDASALTMSVNGVKVLSVPRADMKTDGRIGFRIGKDVNLHIAALNVTRKLAPQPSKKD